MPKPKEFEKELTMDDLIKIAVGEDSYALKDEYKQFGKDIREYERLKDEAWEKIKELDKEIDKEKTPVDEETEKFLQELDPWERASYRDLFSELTDRGKELKELRKELDRKHSSYERLISKLHDEQEKYMKANNKENFENKPFTPLSQKEYKGFSMQQTVRYINEHLQKGTARIVEMTPKEYLQRVAHQVFNSKSTTNAVQGVIPSQVAKYARMMKNGTKFETPYLNLRDKNQEGRHRALAAIVNGYKKIPVIVVE